MKKRAMLLCLAMALFIGFVASGGNPAASHADAAAVATAGVGDGERKLADALRASLESELAGLQSAASQATPSGGAANPVIAVETSKGDFEIELYQQDAPRSVAHILALVERGFYDGMRVHRVEPAFVVQFGDPYSRDLEQRSRWGRGGSGRAIGAVEISPKYTHEVGAVGLAYAAHPSTADSQLYIILADTERSRKLDGEYAVIGTVITGMDVVQTIEMLDVIERVSLR